MGFHCVFICAFFFASIIVQSFGELLVLRHLPTTRGATEKLTCISDDDDSALIWNNAPRDFQPGNPERYNFSECAISDSSQCRAHWGYTGNWKVVESAIRPMAPVFDFRWEGFKEYSTNKIIDHSEYQYVGKANQSSGNVVFSVRGKQNVHVLLCEKEDQTKGPCFWIIIAEWLSTKSVLRYCPNGAPADKKPPGLESCLEIDVRDDNGTLVSNEWRTFGLRWTSAEKIIELIGDAGHEERTILNGHVESWPDVSHMSIRLDETSLLRFHFYEYLLTEKSGSLLYSDEFNFSEEEFCIKLLVGLCPECELWVHLVVENNRNFEIKKIIGNEKSVYDGTLSWRSMKLSKNIKIDGQKRGKSFNLGIRASRTEGPGEGRWAVADLRMCKPAGQRRESTSYFSNIEPDVRCQKLSYNGSTIVNPWSSNKIISNTTNSRKFIDKLIESCGSSCESFGENSLLCNSMGCTCNRGYEGTNCDQTCTDGYHGYNCGEICTPCIIGSCDKITGLCATSLKATLTTENEATLQWDSPLEQNGLIGNYSISLTGKLIACKGSVAGDIEQIMISQPGNKTTLKISGLRPYAEYTARVIAHTIESGSPRTITFKTSETLIPTSKFSNFSLSEDNLTLHWNQPWNCTTITGSTEHAALIFESIESVEKYEEMKQTAGSTFNVAKHLRLTPYTMYRVRLYVTRGWGESVNPNHYQELTWRTPATSPPRVEKFEVYEADIHTNTISLAWMPPNPAYGEIESYRVTIITQRRETIVSENFKVSEERLKCEFREGYVCLRNLQIPATVRRNNIYYMKICAINKGIKRPGREIIFPITAHIFEIKPSKPENLTSTPQSQGITMLNWSRQMFSLTKITEFFINVYQVSTKLKTNKTHEFSTNRSAKENQLNYSVELHLLASTDYVVSIFAVGRRNFTSKESNISISVPGSIAYGNKSDLTVKQYGESIQIQIPAVVNATDNTTVKVCVKGRMTCTYYSDSSTPLTIPEWLAAVYEPEENKTKNLTIGANYNHDVPLNCSLHIGETYEIKLVATDLSPDTSSETLSASITLDMDDDQSAKPNKGWLVGPPILAICLLVLVFTGFRIRKMVRKQEPREPSYVEPISPSLIKILRQPRPFTYTALNPLSMARGTNDCTDLHLQESSVSQLEVVKNESSDDLYSLPKEPDSCSVGIEYFEQYVKDAAASGLLYSQFMLLPKDLTRPYEYGSLPENMPKNRCKYQIAYDHSRVVLNKNPGDPYSDYINASYIKGYRKNKAYIAAEGPKPNTVNDFWKMVWQEEVQVICMLTDVTKDAETEWEKYWPDVGTMVVQGNFHISNIDEHVSANYTLRIFELSHGQNTRQVTHLHYTEWPNLGVPIYPQSLVEYLRKLRQTRAGDGPILVHCSAGDDRTGTVILCDICLHQAVAQKVIDATAVITRMRDSRANMVGTLQQYVLAHIIITESIVFWSTQIPCTDILSTGFKRLRLQLPYHIERLNASEWQEEALKSSATRNPPIAQEEANAKILDLAPDIPEVIYDDVADKHREHINPVSVDSFKMNEQYLACSLPPPLTLASFWGFIVERDIKLIIIMQCSDPKYPTCIDIMPYESIVIPMLDIQVEDETSLDEREYFTYEKLLLRDTSQDKARSQSVAVLTCKGWGCGRNQKPPPPATLISLWRASEKIPRKKGETLVLCDDGITGCGLYLALSFLLERMTVERECNVISAVRSVRRSKREFVQSLKQLDYLYDAAVNYSECFFTYANLP